MENFSKSSCVREVNHRARITLISPEKPGGIFRYTGDDHVKDYIVYRCNTCKKHFILFKNEVSHSEAESKYITCPYHGKHKSISVSGAYDDIKDCMRHDSFKRERGKLKQRGWS